MPFLSELRSSSTEQRQWSHTVPSAWRPSHYHTPRSCPGVLYQPGSGCCLRPGGQSSVFQTSAGQRTSYLCLLGFHLQARESLHRGHRNGLSCAEKKPAWFHPPICPFHLSCLPSLPHFLVVFSPSLWSIVFPSMQPSSMGREVP